MQLSRKTLHASWWRLSLLSVVLFAVLNLLDTFLRARTGYGTADLQGLSSALALRTVFDHWASPPDSALAGFGLGLDYLFMPLYGAALYLGGIAAREVFAPEKSKLRRTLTLLAMAPIAGALFDALENALQLAMLVHGPSDALAKLALQATAGKYAGAVVGLVLSLTAAAAAALQWRGKKKA